MSVTNAAILLAIVAMPIDSAYSIHNACRPYTFSSCAPLIGLVYVLVKIIEIFYLMLMTCYLYCLAASYPLAENINSYGQEYIRGGLWEGGSSFLGLGQREDDIFGRSCQ